MKFDGAGSGWALNGQGNSYGVNLHGNGSSGWLDNFNGYGTTINNFDLSLYAGGGNAYISTFNTGSLTLQNGCIYAGDNNTSISFGGSGLGSINVYDAIQNGSGVTTANVYVNFSGSTVWFNSTSSTYSGSTTINAGTLGLGADNTLPSATDVIINSGGALNVNQKNLTVGTISGSGTLTLGSSGGMLTYGGGSANQTFSGSISGAQSITKQGIYTWTWLGANASYTGQTTISAGTLTIGGGGQLGKGSYSAAITDNAAFIYNSSAAQTLSGIISGTGTLTQSGSGTLTLSGANTYTGGTTIKAGTLVFSGGSSTFTSGPLGPSNSIVLLGDTTGSANAILTHSGAAAVHYYPITVQSGSSGIKTLADVSGTSVNYSSNIVLNDSLTLDSGSSGSIILTGPVTGSGGLNKISSGIVQLNAASSANTYSGNTTISQGTFQLGSATAIPNGSGLGYVILNPASPNTATFDLHGNNQTINGLTSSGTGNAVVDNISRSSKTQTVGTSGSNPSGMFSGVIQNSSSGTLGLTKAGGGTLTLDGANTYSGNTTINAGTLALRGNGSIASSPQISIATGATLDVSAVTSSGYSLNGSGTLALNVNKTGATLTQGQLVLGAKNIAYGGTLTVTASGSALAAGDSFILITSTGTKNGWFNSVSVPSLASGISWHTNKLAMTGVLDIYTFSTTALALTTPVNTAATISALKLANHASSSRGTPVLVSATAPGHGTASVTSGALTYTPTFGFSGSDSFAITFQDGHGWQTIVVSVTVGNGAGQSPNYLSSGTTNISSENYFYVNFAGFPGDTYTVETNSLGSGASWTKWGNITASSTGAMQVLDPVGSGSLFYRTVYPAY